MIESLCSGLNARQWPAKEKGFKQIVCWLGGVIHYADCTAPAPSNVNVWISVDPDCLWPVCQGIQDPVTKGRCCSELCFNSCCVIVQVIPPKTNLLYRKEFNIYVFTSQLSCDSKRLMTHHWTFSHLHPHWKSLSGSTGDKLIKYRQSPKKTEAETVDEDTSTKI